MQNTHVAEAATLERFVVAANIFPRRRVSNEAARPVEN